jgi:hypothetical protein
MVFMSIRASQLKWTALFPDSHLVDFLFDLPLLWILPALDLATV